jgi:hypothetical protein
MRYFFEGDNGNSTVAGTLLDVLNQTSRRQAFPAQQLGQIADATPCMAGKKAPGGADCIDKPKAQGPQHSHRRVII